MMEPIVSMDAPPTPERDLQSAPTVLGGTGPRMSPPDDLPSTPGPHEKHPASTDAPPSPPPFTLSSASDQSPMDQLPFDLKLHILQNLSYGDLQRVRVSTELMLAARHTLRPSKYFSCLACNTKLCRPQEVFPTERRIGFLVEGAGSPEANGLYVAGDVPYYAGPPMWHKSGTDLYLFRWERNKWFLSHLDEDEPMDSVELRLYTAPSGSPPDPEPPLHGSANRWVPTSGRSPAPKITLAYRRVLADELDESEVGTHLAAAGFGPDSSAQSRPVSELELEDSELTLCVPRSQVMVDVSSAAYGVDQRPGRQRGGNSGGFSRYHMRDARCPGCSRFVGVHVVALTHPTLPRRTVPERRLTGMLMLAAARRTGTVAPTLQFLQNDIDVHELSEPWQQHCADHQDGQASTPGTPPSSAAGATDMHDAQDDQEQAQERDPSGNGGGGGDGGAAAVAVGQLFLGKAYVHLMAPRMSVPLPPPALSAALAMAETAGGGGGAGSVSCSASLSYWADNRTDPPLEPAGYNYLRGNCRNLLCNGQLNRRRARHHGEQGGSRRCTMVLSDSEQVLSLQHRWALPGRDAEDACYVNALRPGSFHLGPERVERLAQGRMVVADVSCACCSRIVGWKFVASARRIEGEADRGDDDDEEDQRQRASRANVNQEGRFGLVMTAFRLEGEPEKDEGQQEGDGQLAEAGNAEDFEGDDGDPATAAAFHNQPQNDYSIGDDDDDDDDDDDYGYPRRGGAHGTAPTDGMQDTPPWALPHTSGVQAPHAAQQHQTDDEDEGHEERDENPTMSPTARRRERAGRCRQA